MRGIKETAGDYDAWFRVKVQEALGDRRPTVGHADVMLEMRELIGRK